MECENESRKHLLDFNINNYINNHIIKANKYYKNNLKQELESFDLEIKNSTWRKQKGYYVDGSRIRTIYTSEGEVKFRVTRYKINRGDKWKYVYLSLLYMGIGKWQKISQELKMKVIEKLTTGTTARNIIHFFPKAPLNQSTISRIQSKLEIRDMNERCLDLNYQIPADVDQYKNVYLSIDDAFVTLRKNKKGFKYRIRLGVLCLGKSIKKDSRNSRLIHKRIFAITAILGKPLTTTSLAELVVAKIEDFYGLEEYKLYVCGDGAGWIKKLASYLNGTYVLDKFHWYQKMKRALPTNGSITKELFDLVKFELEHGKRIDIIIDMLTNLLKSKRLTAEQLTRVRETINYSKSNASGIDEWFAQDYIGTFAESNVFHFIKSILATGAKSYGFKSFENIMNLRIANINNIDPMQLIDDSYFESIKNEINDHVFHYTKSKDIEDRWSAINLPILEGKNSKTAETIRKLMNR